MNINNLNNSLTLDEITEYLCQEHAARILQSEVWWTLVPTSPGCGSFNDTGSADGFYAITSKLDSMGQPYGWNKVLTHLGEEMNAPHKDHELLLRSVIKPNKMKLGDAPNLDIITIVCEQTGEDVAVVYRKEEARYNAAYKNEEKRIDNVIKIILSQKKSCEEDQENITTTLQEKYDEEGNFLDYEEVELQGKEWSIPIDRIIERAEKNMEFTAKQNKLPMNMRAAEIILWKNEIKRLKLINQSEDTSERAGESSRAMDEALLNSSSMSQGQQAGK